MPPVIDVVAVRPPWWRRVAALVREVAGMPDYERYVAHRRACHPGEPVLSAKAYYAEYVARRYQGGGSRCC